MKEHPWAAGSNRPRAFIPKVGDTDGTATPLRLCGCFQPSPYLAAQTDVLGCLYGARTRALRMIDVIRRSHQLAPFVRQKPRSQSTGVSRFWLAFSNFFQSKRRKSVGYCAGGLFVYLPHIVRSHLSFSLAASVVCHCMLKGLSGPSQDKGMM